MSDSMQRRRRSGSTEPPHLIRAGTLWNPSYGDIPDSDTPPVNTSMRTQLVWDPLEEDAVPSQSGAIDIPRRAQSTGVWSTTSGILSDSNRRHSQPAWDLSGEEPSSQTDSIAIPSHMRRQPLDSGYGGTASPAHTLANVPRYQTDRAQVTSPACMDFDEALTDDDDVFLDNSDIPFQNYMIGEEGMLTDDPGEEEEEEFIDEVDGDDERHGQINQGSSSMTALEAWPDGAAATSSSAAERPSSLHSYRVPLSQPIDIISRSPPSAILAQSPSMCLSMHSPIRRGSLVEAAFSRTVFTQPTPCAVNHESNQRTTQTVQPANILPAVQRSQSLQADAMAIKQPLGIWCRDGNSTSFKWSRDQPHKASNEPGGRSRFFSENDIDGLARARLHSMPEEERSEEEDDDVFIVPPRRDRSRSLPAVQNQHIVRQRFGQELRRISDEFNTIYSERSSSPSSFPGARRRRSWWSDFRQYIPMISSGRPSHHIPMDEEHLGLNGAARSGLRGQDEEETSNSLSEVEQSDSEHADEIDGLNEQDLPVPDPQVSFF